MLPGRCYEVVHETEYEYESPVVLAQHLLHLGPRVCAWQRLLAQTLEIDPLPASRRDGVDAFGNPLVRISIDTPHRRLLVCSRLGVEIGAREQRRGGVEPSWQAVRAGLESPDGAPLDPKRYRHQSPHVRVKSELYQYASPSFPDGRPLFAACCELMARIHEDFTFDPEATEVGTSVLDLLQTKRGVCQDFAHFMIGALRALGLSARYVSGYLLTEPPPGQPRLLGADASHAWVAVWIPAAAGDCNDCDDSGWIEFDPTNDCLADQRHVVVAYGRDFGDVSPLRGVIQGGGEHRLDVRVSVIPTAAPD